MSQIENKEPRDQPDAFVQQTRQVRRWTTRQTRTNKIAKDSRLFPNQ